FDDKVIPNTRQVTADLTYKGPRIDKETKSRLEHVCHIVEPDKMELILEKLGFINAITINKHRILYTMDYKEKHVEIVADKIEYLDGYFAEFEIQIDNPEEQEDAKNIMFELLDLLGYSKNASMKISYLELVLEHLGTLKIRSQDLKNS
ncbi:MAG: class IV adenylate cyclase, partial [Promethearchaeota archaeon]